MMQLRMTQSIHKKMRSDLCRSHPFAYERVGYMFVKPAGNTVLVATGYEIIPDEFYIKDKTVGARIDHRAIALAMKRADKNGEGILHVHIHNISGYPLFSRDDVANHSNFLRSFQNASPQMPHGFLLLSDNKMMLRVWLPGKEISLDVFRYTIEGLPLSFDWNGRDIIG